MAWFGIELLRLLPLAILAAADGPPGPRPAAGTFQEVYPDLTQERICKVLRLSFEIFLPYQFAEDGPTKKSQQSTRLETGLTFNMEQFPKLGFLNLKTASPASLLGSVCICVWHLYWMSRSGMDLMHPREWPGKILAFDMLAPNWLSDLFDSKWASAQLHALQTFFDVSRARLLDGFNPPVLRPSCGKMALHGLRRAKGWGLRVLLGLDKLRLVLKPVESCITRQLRNLTERFSPDTVLIMLMVLHSEAKGAWPPLIRLAQLYTSEADLGPSHPEVGVREDLAEAISRLCRSQRGTTDMSTCGWELEPARTPHQMATIHAVAGTVLATEFQGRHEVEVVIYVEGVDEVIEHGLKSGKPTSAPCLSMNASVLWNVTCFFPSYVGNEYFSEGIVYALAETSMRVRCSIPAGAAVTASSGGLQFNLNLQIEKSVMALSFRSRPDTGKGKIVACSRPMWDVGEIVSEYPTAVRDWLDYHYKLGISYFDLYDDDGSLLPHIPEWMMRDGVVNYFANWPRRFGKLDGATRRGWRYCTEILAFDHCAYRNAGYADWLINLGSLDVYIFLPQAPPGTASLLPAISELAAEAEAEDQRPVCALFMEEVLFGGKRFAGDGLASSFFLRASNGTWKNPYHRGLNVMALDGSGIYSEPHRPVCRHGRTSRVFHVTQMRFNHYVDAFRLRCAACRVRDDSMLAYFA